MYFFSRVIYGIANKKAKYFPQMHFGRNISLGKINSALIFGAFLRGRHLNPDKNFII